MTPILKDTWYEDFFQGINCEMLEKAYSEEWTRKEVDFLMDVLMVKPGHQILDIPCGYGRHSIELSKRGIHITGIDISQTFIDKLTERIKSDHLDIVPIRADILTVQLNQVFSGAICMGNSFGYFNYDKMKQFVEKVADCLEPGSKFIINSGMIAESILPNFSKHRSYTLGTITMEIANTYFAGDSFMTSNLQYTRDGRTENHAFKHYVFTLGEIKRLLGSYGLQVIAAYSSTEKKEYVLGDEQIYIVAEKE